MKILLASSEVFPYSKTGGLADMVGALGKALAADGHTVATVTPFYRGIAQKHSSVIDSGMVVTVPLGASSIEARIWKTAPAKNLTVYFVDQPGVFDRPALYGEGGRDYPDNGARFIFFSKAVTQFARTLPERPEIVHVHDWQVGLVPLLIRHEERTAGWAQAPATVLTIHNLAYQGVFPPSEYRLTNLPPSHFSPQGLEFYGQMNCLKAGIVYSDLITTVSPRYAREIMTEQFGCGLDGVLRSRHDRLVGILNGVDYSEWNTEKNPFLKFTYTAQSAKA